ncbi:MAG: GspE/PulE family protein [Candidatus Taylorbacteria bacterium]|nr:GspE/PulE family protein [Candidatus Taylorbacteria bacterium]
MIQFDEDKQNRRVKELYQKEEEELAKVIATRHNLEYIDLSGIPIGTDALKVIEEIDAHAAKVAAFAISDKKLKVAVRVPEEEKTAMVIRSLIDQGYEVKQYVTSTTSLEKAWAAYADLSKTRETTGGSIDIAHDEILDIINTHPSLVDIQNVIKDILANKKGFKTSRILEHVLAGALSTNASDIHIEPEEEYVRIRYRLDGVLTNVANLDTSVYNLVLSRIKLLSGMKLNVKKDAQDGRFSIKLSDMDIEVRASILPGAYNESVVLRLLNPKSIAVPLEELGIPKKLLSVILEQIEKPNGMILTTGPTGSGKTTTLYAFLKKVYNPGVKVITIEDPIEYHLPGIVQTQVNDKGYNFLEGLRAALRQDPDVIMVGEIRDSETAQIAINSSLTGHLVFSTLHTNNAAGSFPRLIDLGINPHVISSAINIALAQRLVRKLCPVCRKEITLDGTNKEKIEKVLAGIFDKSEIPQNNSKIWQSVGCEKCNMTGYKGRIGIYEGILVDESVNKSVEMSDGAQEIQKTASPQGILMMSQDGIIKVLSGMTSLDELERIIDINL